jgi:hypothetical protein
VKQVRALVLLLVYAAILVLATPGLDFLGAQELTSERQVNLLREQAPEPVVKLLVGVAEFNRNYRLPLVEFLEPLQKPFRIAQTWSLYRDGPGKVRRLEVRIDGEPVYRSGDAELDWLAPQLESRRIRPVAETTTRLRQSRNWWGLTRLVVQSARRDFPQTEKVEIVALSGSFPGENLREKHRIVATAPDWHPALQ